MTHTELFDTISTSLFTIKGTLDYEDITTAFIRLGDELAQVEDIDWYLGEGSECCLDDLIIGAYWHYTEWHAGQSSASYAALCSLGQIFSPGMSSVEPDNAAYEMLEVMAKGVQAA